MKLVFGLVGILLLLPIRFYVLWWVIQQVHPDRLIMFLFWVYAPLAIVLAIIEKVMEKVAEKL